MDRLNYTAKSNINNILQLGFFIYTDYYLPFLLVAIQLLISMIAAIIISLMKLFEMSMVFLMI